MCYMPDKKKKQIIKEKKVRQPKVVETITMECKKEMNEKKTNEFLKLIKRTKFGIVE